MTLDYAATIKSSITMRDLCEREGIMVNRSGFACCPFHAEKTPSMKVYADPERGYHCFGCGDGGDVIHFAMRYFGTDFSGAIRQLNDEFHLGLKLDKRVTTVERYHLETERLIRQTERMLYQLRVELAQQAYYDALDNWLEIDRDISENAPRGPLEPFTGKFASALFRKAEAEHELDMALDAWNEVIRQKPC